MQPTYSNYVKFCQPSCPAQQMENQIYIQVWQVFCSLDGTTSPKLILEKLIIMMKSFIFVTCIQICPGYKSTGPPKLL